MKEFCFTVDDNIRCFQQIAKNRYQSIFDQPYLAMYKRLHDKYGVKVQLNLFYAMKDFNLSMMPDDYRDEWAANADWLKLSFHSRYENPRPYEFSDYDEVYRDCRAVHDEIRRFAGEASLGLTTTIHYCLTTPDGLQALIDNGVRGLLGLFGTAEQPRESYCLPEAVYGDACRRGDIVTDKDVKFAAIDNILNSYADVERTITSLEPYIGRDIVKIMIHEQYFYEDYAHYHPQFEAKLDAALALLQQNGYESRFFEEICHISA